jgi:hypothetical protein
MSVSRANSLSSVRRSGRIAHLEAHGIVAERSAPLGIDVVGAESDRVT